MLEPSRPEAEEVGATDAQELGGGVGIEIAAVESVECLVDESKGEAFRELMFFKVTLSAKPAPRASLFVSLATLGLLKAWPWGEHLFSPHRTKEQELVLLC